MGDDDMSDGDGSLSYCGSSTDDGDGSMSDSGSINHSADSNRFENLLLQSLILVLFYLPSKLLECLFSLVLCKTLTSSISCSATTSKTIGILPRRRRPKPDFAALAQLHILTPPERNQAWGKPG